jgi:hypothetical protein
MPRPKDIRVRVHDGSGEKLLGEGTYVGDVQAYALAMPDGSLQSLPDAEQPPDPKLMPEGAKMLSLGKNPKIVMDDGRVVYGCQVWWQPIEDADMEECAEGGRNG